LSRRWLIRRKGPTVRHGFLPKTLVVAIALTIAALTGPALAAPDRVALVIGNSAYKNAAMLPNPSNDAAAIAQALRKIGFEVVEGRDLPKRAMEEKIIEFSRKLDRASLALFFYAGHGLQIGGRNYLLPIDAALERPGDLSFETIDLSQVLGQMEAEKRVNLVFLDACRDNPFAKSLARSMGTRSATVGQGLASVQSAVGTMIAYATQPDNVALDGAGPNSPFTTALLKYIGTPGLEVRAMMTRVRADVLAATNQKQVPWDHSSLIGEVVLAPLPNAAPAVAAVTPKPAESAPPPAALAVSEAGQAWAVTKDTTSIAVMQAFIKEFGNTVYGQMARARLQELQVAAAPPKPHERVASVAPAAPAHADNSKTCRSIVGTWTSWASRLYGDNDTRFLADGKIIHPSSKGTWSCKDGQYVHQWDTFGKRGPYILSANGKHLVKIEDNSVSFSRK
jgi:uncharacterized caspase-like protein